MEVKLLHLQSHISPLTEGEIARQREQNGGGGGCKVKAGIETDGIRYSVRKAGTKPGVREGRGKLRKK